MQQVTLSGTLLTNPGIYKDKNDRQFIRFTLTCGSTDVYGRTVFTHYRCISYIPGYEEMKRGDQLFVVGRFSPSIGKDKDGKPYLNLDVMVMQISGGYRAKERAKSEK